MPRITRVYTRTGDDGTTGLTGGSRVAKDAARVGLYGTVDELNATIGAALASGLDDEIATALAWAASGKGATALVDADLQGPSVAVRLGLPPRPDLADCIDVVLDRGGEAEDRHRPTVLQVDVDIGLFHLPQCFVCEPGLLFEFRQHGLTMPAL